MFSFSLAAASEVTQTSTNIPLLRNDIRQILPEIRDSSNRNFLANADYSFANFQQEFGITQLNATNKSEIFNNYCKQYTKRYEQALVKKYKIKNSTLSLSYICPQLKSTAVWINSANFGSDAEYLLEDSFDRFFLTVGGDLFFSRIAKIDRLDDLTNAESGGGKHSFFSIFGIPQIYQLFVTQLLSFCAFALGLIVLFKSS